MAIAVQMPMAERERLARALGLSVHTKGPGKTLTLNQFVSRPDPIAWRKAETGHAVLATESGALAGSGASAEIPAGPEAIQGMWSAQAPEHADTASRAGSAESVPLASALPANSPVIVHTDVCVELAYGRPEAIAFFTAPPVEIRLATATYLALLGAAESPEQLRRLQRFVGPYAVLSLGPMASSRSVELMMLHALNDGLNPLDALIAATALAHEIPLVARDPGPFLHVAELAAVRPY
jgi:predicted nucleic acid-binding protein